MMFWDLISTEFDFRIGIFFVLIASISMRYVKFYKN
jgi:hypothetical protein